MREFEDPARQLRELLQGQQLAALSTAGDDGSYASLVGFAAEEDGRHLLFSTLRTSRKFANLCRDTRVALLIDNRQNRLEDFIEAVAVTAVGRARELTGADCDLAGAVYLAKFPHQADFLRSPGSALFRVRVETFLLVSRFQQVTELRL